MRSRAHRELVEVADDDTWEALVRVAPSGEIFHTTAWLRVLEEVFAVQMVRLGLIIDGALVAGLPLLVRRVGPFQTVGSPFFNVATPQMGPICTDASALPELLNGFDEFQRRARISFCELVFPAPVPAEDLQRLGYQVEAYQTLVLDLVGRTRNDLWQACAGKCRNQVRKAQRSSVKVEAAGDLSFLPVYWRMAKAVYAKQRREPLIPQRFYEALWSRFAPSGALRILLARHEGEIVAGGVFLVYGRRLYYLDGVSFHEYNHLCPNNLIQWTLLEWAVDQDLDLYDMVGAGIPSIARFKASFGGRLTILPYVHRTNSVVARVGLHAYRRLRPVVKRVALGWRGLYSESN